MDKLFYHMTSNILRNNIFIEFFNGNKSTLGNPSIERLTNGKISRIFVKIKGILLLIEFRQFNIRNEDSCGATSTIFSEL